ncbi:MAG: hypothetical protein ACK452_01310 [Bacteroidota bacterium]
MKLPICATALCYANDFWVHRELPASRAKKCVSWSIYQMRGHTM